MAQRDLPTFYYHTHFCEFLSFLTGPSQHLISDAQQAFIKQFYALNKLEQASLVRLINRKYPYIKLSSLKFAELPQLDAHLAKLHSLGLSKNVSSNDVFKLLPLLTKTELTSIYNDTKTNSDLPVLKSANKQCFVDACMTLPPNKLIKHEVFSNYILRNTDHHIDYFLFLYFGHSKGKLNQFSMRDMGIMNTRDNEAQMQSRFNDYHEAFSCFSLAKISSELNNIEFCSEHELKRFTQNLPKAVGERAHRSYERILFKLSKKAQPYNVELALSIAEKLDLPAAQEYWCRQSYKVNNKQAVQERLNQIIDQPSSDHLLAFAEDFLARKFKQKRTSILTDMLRDSARHLSLDEIYKGDVERGAIAYYKSRGKQAWRTENILWQNLFGLCFWHELFELEGLGLATPFDYLPICLKHYNFYEVAKEHIEQRLNKCKTNRDLLVLVTKHASAHLGKSQGIVRWHAHLIEHLKILIENAPLQGLKSQLLKMCQNWRAFNDGYPDIMVLEGNQLRFEEIKAQGDSLRRNQLLQIESLKNAGFDVSITTVDWVFDSKQPYAVIDIETTGGRAGTHKITEIGMLKMIDGQVVDQWQSLINPLRRIPAMITSLTGITNDMVQDAPIFADIADELESFTEDCIFVAHNVNFDYGFIKEEFARLGRSYKRPKLCTVQQMRKHFSGLKSYSLANLSETFNIKMQRHHRALSDAIAASELLNLVNEKRQNKNP